MMFSAVGDIHRMLVEHPLTHQHPMDAYKRWLRWQIASRVSGMPIVAPFVDNTQIAIGTEHRGMRGNIYVGLLEFEDMSFTAHFLRKGDLFGDVGSNIGAYTILAAGVRGANVIAVEPVPATVAALKRNVGINAIGDLVTIKEIGVGETGGTMYFSVDQDCMNHIVSEKEGLQIPVSTLDAIFAEKAPTLLKIDVEGFEAAVLNGAKRTLADPQLEAIIIELNGLGARYGYDDRKTDAAIRDYGFQSFAYDPWTRTLSPAAMSGEYNTLYVRDVESASQRVKNSPSFSVLGQSV
jgi:FkbM family methyltransferase